VRIFLDTNVLVSALMGRGLCAELPENVISAHDLLICEPVLQEVERVLSEKIHLPGAVIKNYLRLLKAESQVVKAQEVLKFSFKDASDIPILACVIASKPDAFVTGDNAILELGSIENIPILSPRQLWQKLAGF
jgi:putative PIN family toxin of toxin-antitoxin system